MLDMDTRTTSLGVGLMGWVAFRDGLTTLNLNRLAGRPEAFRGYHDDSDFGPLRIRRVGSEGVALRGERSRARIDAFGEAIYWVGLALTGEFRVRQGDNFAVLRKGGFALLDPTRPYVVEVPQGAIESLWIGAPRDMIESRLVDVDAVLGVDLADECGPGALATRFLSAALQAPIVLGREDAGRIANILLDVVAAAATAKMSHGASSSYRGAILRRLKLHIDERIDDANLSVAELARCEGVSPRYLAKLFEFESQTASSWIWARRLEKSRMALLRGDADLRISQVALAHGFKSVSHFSRAFRNRYGEPPSQILASRRRSR